jgi:hypothetical protein
MDLNIINNANFFYQLKGFKYIDSPWLVCGSAIDTTTPSKSERFTIKNKFLVGSGEQSFIDMIINGKLEPGRYCTTTPCFRDEIEDELHQIYFMKTELIDTFDVSQNSLQRIISICKEFFETYTTVDIIKTDRDQFDIIDKKTEIELGSYGIRNTREFSWIYATGVAEPRLSKVLSKNNKPGYHNSFIPKGQLGEFSKIQEEFEEFKETVLNDNKVTSLCELSDMIGAIELYLNNKFPGVKIDDLIKMKDLNRRAFENGKR